MEEDDKVGKENKRKLDGYISVTVKLMEKGKRLEKQNIELQVKFKNLNKEHKKLLDNHKVVEKYDQQAETEELLGNKENTVEINEKVIVFTFKRVELDDEQWDELKQHAD